MVYIAHKLTVLLKSKQAQSLSEYAVVLAVVAGAIVAMNIFMKRSVQGAVYDTLSQYGNVEYTQEYNPLLGGETTGSQTDIRTKGTYREFGEDGIEHSQIIQNTIATGLSNREEIIE